MNTPSEITPQSIVTRARLFSEKRPDLLACMVLVVAGLIVYANSYQVPWYFDDFAAITSNRVVQDPRDLFKLLFSFSSRGPAVVSFVLNYSLHGEELFGYHLVNNSIHILTAIVVYHILKRVIGTWALAGALVFLCHPLQTSAVTYIVQRMTSLCGLFLFVSLFAFIRAREVVVLEGTMKSARYVAWYAVMLLMCFFAILTKQNAIFLPVGIFVFEHLLLQRSAPVRLKQRLLYFLPFISLPTVYGFVTLLVTYINPLLSGTRISTLTGVSNISPLQYLVTEFSVLWVYIRMLFLPYGLTLDHGYPAVTSLVSLQSSVAFFGLVMLAALAWKVRHSMPAVSFGISWFFAALAVESTLIPLDPLFEHRLYIPMFGFVIVLIDLIRRYIPARGQQWFVSLLVVIYALLAIQRNSLWAEPTAFLEDNLRKAPHNYRIYQTLAVDYMIKKRYAEAEKLLLRASELAVLPDDAMIIYKVLGTFYDESGQAEKSIAAYKKAIGLDPRYFKAYLGLAVVYSKLGEYATAEELLRKVVNSKDADGSAYYNLGVVLYKLDRRKEAYDAFASAVRLAPYDADALFNLALLMAEFSDYAEAQRMVARLSAINPERGKSLQEEIRVIQHDSVKNIR